ncbi:MAG: DNA gyrase inhibitor YacG [Candidatus Loosdrechtia sp.]|uniref:DNA gyrase inhibitor YacG n=1 Tax=Candidatus Loosdrechtia sp. TaxID=3101272 RepID=UPI003A78B59D|nr:MAG: DNA gyrase inhibitor YacG [Candidatus Jettenia sp. AMX2]
MARIKCPNCRKELFYHNIKDIPDFPFCTKRCKQIDLGAWLDEKYRIEEPISQEALSRIDEGEKEDD